MRKTLLVLLLAFAVLATAVTPGDAGWRGGVFVGVGPYWGPYPYPYYYYPPPPAYYVYRPPAVVVEQAPVYVERPPVERPPVEQPPQAAASSAYWYYCESARGYYPTVPSCAEEWVKVPERPR